jgi:hypothetical protein
VVQADRRVAGQGAGNWSGGDPRETLHLAMRKRGGKTSSAGKIIF